MILYTQPYATAPRAVLDTLERHGVAIPADPWVSYTSTEATLYAGDPEQGGTYSSGPYTLGSGAGLTQAEVVAYVRGATVATTAAADRLEWEVQRAAEGWEVQQGQSTWTIEAGVKPEAPEKASR